MEDWVHLFKVPLFCDHTPECQDPEVRDSSIELLLESHKPQADRLHLRRVETPILTLETAQVEYSLLVCDEDDDNIFRSKWRAEDAGLYEGNNTHHRRISDRPLVGLTILSSVLEMQIPLWLVEMSGQGDTPLCLVYWRIVVQYQ